MIRHFARATAFFVGRGITWVVTDEGPGLGA